MSKFIPTVERFEILAPELLLVKLSQHKQDDNLNEQQLEYGIELLTRATRLWLIIRSLYDEQSDYWFTPSQKYFQCAEWYKHFVEKLPNLKSLTADYLIFDESTEFVKQNFLQALQKKYSFQSYHLEKFLKSYPFEVAERTFRNNFTSLAICLEPWILKPKDGKYQKCDQNLITTRLGNNELESLANWEYIEELNFMTPDVATIVDLLVNKFNHQQRMFIHHDYIVPEHLRDLAANQADFLKEVWKRTPIVPLKIRYYSASQDQENNYIVYPVCLYYYQRAYYLSAFGQTPCCQNSTQNQWYNYRLERIVQLEKLSWESSNLPFFQAEILQQEAHYSPEYIQQELEEAYGFDFYQPSDLMLLKFEPDFARRYIDNSFRHKTFEKIERLEEVIALIKYAKPIAQEKLIETVQNSPNSAYYTLSYRQNDNNVIMRLRAWCPNVEILLPWNLRQRMKEDIAKTWKLYQTGELS